MIERAACCILLLALQLAFFSVAADAQDTPEREAARLQEQAQQLLDGGRYNDGIEVAKRALALREKTLGTEHLDIAASVQTLGLLYMKAGNRDLAESCQRRALTLRENLLGPEHPDTARSLMHLADTYLRTHNSRAEPLYRRALQIFEHALGAEHLDTSIALLGLANLYTETAEYDRAEPLFERALAIRERAAPESPVLARVLNNFAGMYRNMGAYARAKELYRRALAVREKILGPEHPEVATSLANLAIIYNDTGDVVESEALFRRALSIEERALGIEHPTTVRMLSYLATLYSNTGAYAQAEPLFRRVIALQEQSQSASKVDLAASLNNLAGMYVDMGRYEQAEPVCRQALEIAEKSLGADHPFVWDVVGTLGVVHRQLGRYAEAEPLLKRSIAISEAALGTEHRDTARHIRNLADLYADSRTPLRAQPLYRRAIAIYEKTLGANYPDTATTLRLLAVSHWARGERQRALPLLQRARAIEEKNAARFLLTASEARKQDYQRTLTEKTSEDVSFAMSIPGSAATVLGLTSVLQYKGRVLDAVSDNVARIRRSVAPADQALLEQLADIAGQLSVLTYGQGGNLSAEQYRARLAELTSQQTQLEAELASRSRTFSRELVPVTLANIQRAIPANAALVEWFRYTPFDPTRISAKARRGPPRYVAYVLKRSGQPVAVDIGPAQAIEALVHRFRVALADSASSDVKQRAAALSNQLLVPLRAHLRGAEHLLMSPDGELNLVPMGALLDESGAYLAERVEVSFLTSGRDLLRIADDAAPLAAPVVMADPEYGKRGALPPTPTSQARRSLELDRGGLSFRPLNGTALEARELQSLLQLEDGNVLLRRDASETRLKHLKAPRILHIASHGFFLSDQQLSDAMTRRRGAPAVSVTNENPLLRSGIALAGANELGAGEDDGILTALEATQLDLSGTLLVVLSACDSGVGEVQNGEGVYGLRRALALAGAQTQITSLWKVSDEATRALMVDYYRRLLQGEGRAAALRRAQRTMLASAGFSHPYYWASFIPIGDWNPLPKPSGKPGTHH